jgi:hypothetical protein
MAQVLSVPRHDGAEAASHTSQVIDLRRSLISA